MARLCGILTVSAGAVWTPLEGTLRKEDLGSLAERQIPRPVAEATTSVGSEAQALQRRRGGAPSLRPRRQHSWPGVF